MSWYSNQIANSLKPAIATLQAGETQSLNSLNAFYQKSADILAKAQATNTANLQPYVSNGGNMFNAYAGALGLPDSNGNAAPSNDTILSRFMNSPGYQAMLQQGLMAVNNKASAAGLLGSGAQGQALTKYAADYANTGFNNYTNSLLQGAQLGSQAAGQLAATNTSLANQGSSAALSTGGKLSDVYSSTATDIGRLQAGNREAFPGLNLVGMGASSF